MPISYRPATPEDAPECLVLRGQTRENAISVERLAAIGITAQSWGDDIRNADLPGVVALLHGRIVGYCFGDTRNGEVVVLAMLPEVESQGVGKRLLADVVSLLHAKGFNRLFLGCSADPAVRSHGFYRHLGWRSTGQFDDRGDDILELHCSAVGATTLPR